MLRRVMSAAAAVAGAWALFGQAAGADYPPVPPKVTTTTVAPTTTTKPPKVVTPTTVPRAVPTTVLKKVVPKPEVVVVVREVPVRPRRALVFTGTNSAVPLTALATASVGLGIILVCLSRLGWGGKRRRHHHRRRFA